MNWPGHINEVICGNCLDVMKGMPDACIDTVITDPPYGLKFMGKDWDHSVPGTRFWSEILRVAKPGAICLAFGGTRTYHRLVCAIEDAGWEIRDCIMWVYGSGFPKSLNISKAIDKAAVAKREIIETIPDKWAGKGNMLCRANQKQAADVNITAPSTDAAKLWDGWGTALKPACEIICVAMKSLDGTFAQNALKHGVAGLNINGGRVPTSDTLHPGSGQIGYGSKHNKHEPFTEYQQSPAGRWPNNVIYDGSEEVVRLFPVTKDGSAARFFYCAKASRKERGENNTHPTIKPLVLMEYLCRLTATPIGGIVLDPFLGSGTTAIAAIRSGRDFIGIDVNPHSCRIAEQRLAAEKNPK